MRFFAGAAVVRIVVGGAGIGLGVLLDHDGSVSPVPTTTFALVVVAGLAVSIGVRARFASASARDIAVRTSTDVAAVAAGAYAVGLGPMITGFVALAMIVLLGDRTHGLALRPLAVSTAVALVAGQLAVSTGLAPSTIRAGELDVVAAAIAWSVAMVAETFRTAERRVEGMRGTLESSEAHHRTLIEHGSEIVLVLDGSGVATYVAPSYARVFGITPAERLELPNREVVHPDDLERWERTFAQLGDEPGGNAPFEVRTVRHDGSWRWLSGTLTNRIDDPAVAGVVLNAHDVTDEREARDALDRATLYDPETGLANRRLASDLLRRRLRRQRRAGTELLVLYVEIDQFELHAKAHGTAASDELVGVTARRLGRLTEADDILARVGRNQFLIVSEAPHDDAVTAAVADRAARALQEPIIVEGTEVYLTPSIGVSRVGPGVTDPDQALLDAEMAMITARNDGGDRVVIFGPADERRATSRVKLSGALRRALEAGELSVHFQPIMHLATGDVQGAEALVRWNHPSEGQIMPDEFIPIAEASGIIVPLGSYVLEQACRAVASARRKGAPGWSVAVNISGRQLEDPELDSIVERVLLDTGLAPAQLTLEVTESALPRDVNAAIERLGPLRRLGVRIAIDDFGTGYSSLGYLKALRPDVIKIDRSFIAGFLSDPGDSAIVAAVVNLGKAVGIEVLAEGVEDADQAAALREMGCDLAQGYLFGPPGPAADLIDLDVVGSDRSRFAVDLDPPS
jgi:diguanylate cyclase (GGDEF)-like protein/PAS domain S-box-containing protein